MLSSATAGATSGKSSDSLPPAGATMPPATAAGSRCEPSTMETDQRQLVVPAPLTARLTPLAAAPRASAIDVGEKVPSGLTLHHGFPPERIDLDERLAGKNVLLVGLPGAFTPT